VTGWKNAIARTGAAGTVLTMDDAATHTEATLIVATDGSALGNPGPGGWAWYADGQFYGCGGDPGPVTNNQMEIIALTRAMEALRGRNVIFEVDSQYVINAVTKWHFGWRKREWKNSKGEPVANRDLLEVALGLLEERRKAGLTTDFRWVRGHVGHPRNEQADRHARTMAETARRTGRRTRTGVPGTGPTGA
jgi:ribonuclease HI